ncbi:MAG: class I adenylate-forming enzyme family protein [Desulfarculaceae bacterium]|jgi:acyl-CoA synthetase (AMP-forming)/AMP-acid ligase II
MSEKVPNFDEFLGLTYGQVLDKLAAECPDKEFLVFQDQRLTYARFHERVLQMAAALKKLGLQKGDRVGVLFPNCLEFLYVQQAVLYLGGVFISLSTRYRKFEITYMMKHAGARFLFCIDQYLGADFVALLEEIRPELPEMETIVVKGEDTPGWATAYSQVEEIGREIDLTSVNNDPPEPEDIASILYTSGSTGTPKGVMSSHRCLLWDSTRVCERLRIGPDDVFLMMLPCSHIFASFVLLTNAMMGRSKIIVMETFEPGEALKLQQEEKVSVLYGVPTMFTLMLSHPDFDKYDLTSNRTGYMSGAACPVELVRAVMQKMHCNISAAYGMTEACCITITKYEDDEYIKAGTAGYPIRDLELKIVDENRHEVPQGTVGEIGIKGLNLFSGYFKQPELTKAAHDEEGFFYTGDLAMLDPDSRLVVAGRKKEMIIRGGFNIYPAEVEEQICLISGVQYAAVVGISDPKLGERTVACVMPEPGHDLDPESIRAWCKERLANYKVPDYVKVMEQFPMTTTNKIQKFKIKQTMEAQLGGHKE